LGVERKKPTQIDEKSKGLRQKTDERKTKSSSNCIWHPTKLFTKEKEPIKKSWRIYSLLTGVNKKGGLRVSARLWEEEKRERGGDTVAEEKDF